MKPLYALGIMTGTSCDGADLALLEITVDGSQVSEKLIHTASKNFPQKLRARLRHAQKGALNIPNTAELAKDYSIWLANYASFQLKKWKTNIKRTFISVHGQTVWHDPNNQTSVQLIEPSIVSQKCKCTLTTYFRQPDLAQHGQGAPLVPYYHWLKAKSFFSKLDFPLSIHNIGGISNFTYISSKIDEIIAFDTGPGNALIDLAVEKMSNGRLKFDHSGKIALQSLNEIDWIKIEKLSSAKFFKKMPPKSTGRELFNEKYLKKFKSNGKKLVAETTALTAISMANAYYDFIFNKKLKLNTIYFAGGGAKNKTLLSLFRLELCQLLGNNEIRIKILPREFSPIQSLEAIAFARLGFEALIGNPVSLKKITGAKKTAIGVGIFPGENFKEIMSVLCKEKIFHQKINR